MLKEMAMENTLELNKMQEQLQIFSKFFYSILLSSHTNQQNYKKTKQQLTRSYLAKGARD